MHDGEANVSVFELAKTSWQFRQEQLEKEVAMKIGPLTEPRKRRLKRKRQAWPKWLRSKLLIRWLFIGGAFVYRLCKAVLSVFGDDDG